VDAGAPQYSFEHHQQMDLRLFHPAVSKVTLLSGDPVVAVSPTFPVAV